MGLIYIIHLPNGKKYIGQHNTNNINKRKNSHKRSYKAFCEKISSKNEIPKGYCTALYSAFKKYTFNKCIFVILENNIANEKLNSLEDEYILSINTLSPNGYNLKLNNNDTLITFSNETLERMSISQSNVFKENLHKYRKKHDELEGVPQFVTFFESGGIRGYRINNHPNCSFKQFTDAITPILELKQQMLNFLKECEKTPYITMQKEKHFNGIPKGIQEQNPGKFLVCFTYKSIKYTKFFGLLERDKNLIDAINYMEITKKSLENNDKNLVEKVEIKSSKIGSEIKKGDNIPKGITERSTGYVVDFSHKKQRYTKTFIKSSISKEENLKLAIEYMTNKRVEVLNNTITEEPLKETLYQSNIKIKKEKNIPPGIIEHDNGYIVKFSYECKLYQRSFIISSNSKETNFELAQEWMQIRKQELLNNLPSSSKSNCDIKKEKNIPKGIQELQNGYLARIQGKNKSSKTFSKPTNTKEENLRLAIKWLNENKNIIKNKLKEKGSETK